MWKVNEGHSLFESDWGCFVGTDGIKAVAEAGISFMAFPFF